MAVCLNAHAAALLLLVSAPLAASLRQDPPSRLGLDSSVVAEREARTTTTRSRETAAPTSSPTPACDTSNSATSSAGKTCNDYREQLAGGDRTLESFCSYYDDEVDDSDFTFRDMCCICPNDNNDGTTTTFGAPPTPYPTPSPTPTCGTGPRAQSKAYKTCRDYEQLLRDGDKTVEDFCSYYDDQDIDDSDFTFQAMCCICPDDNNNDGTTTTRGGPGGDTPAPTPLCDTSGSAMSSINKTCNDYLQDLQNGDFSVTTFCSYYDDAQVDDEDFTFQDMCGCICATPAPTTSNVRTTTTRGGNNGDLTTTRPGGGPPSALGDPHVTNTNHQRFDINHPGSFVLARIPREGPALLEVNGTIESRNHICNHFFTSAQVGGKWVGDVIRVRALTNFPWLAEDERWLFGIQTAPGGQWRSLVEFPAGSDAELESFQREGVEVSLKAHHAQAKPTLNLTRLRNTDRPSDGRFEVALRSASPPRDARQQKTARISFTAKLFWINIELHDLLALGYDDVAGVLGTDVPDPELAEPSGKCLDWLRKKSSSSKLSLLQTQEGARPADSLQASLALGAKEVGSSSYAVAREAVESRYWEEFLTSLGEGEDLTSFARATL